MPIRTYTHILQIYIFLAKQRIRVRITNWGWRRMDKKFVLSLKNAPNWFFSLFSQPPLSIGLKFYKFETTRFIWVKLTIEWPNRDRGETRGTILINFPSLGAQSEKSQFCWRRQITLVSHTSSLEMLFVWEKETPEARNATMSSTGIGSRKRKEPTRRSERIKQLKDKSETQFPHVPEEILVTILSKLPVKSLLRFRCVSKHWGSLITDPKFNLSSPKQQVIVVYKYWSPDCSLHLINDEALSVEVPKPKQLEVRYRKLDRGLTIHGSCNGLVLLSNTMDLLFLWNPSTRCCRKVLSHAHLATFDRSVNASGLC